MYRIQGADQREYGPATADDVRQWIRDRRVHGRSLTRMEGSTEWKPLFQFPEFAAALGAMAPGPPSLGQSVEISRRGTNGTAIASFVLGLVGLACCQVVVFSAAGLVCGIVALTQLRPPSMEDGRGLAIAGIILSSIGLLISVLAYSIGFLRWALELMK